jgi:hypothetical protein
MRCKLAGAALLATIISASPALAQCNSFQTFSPDFQTTDPAWDMTPAGAFASSGGQAKLTAPPNSVAIALYDGQFFDCGDYTVNTLAPAAAPGASPSTIGGLMFGLNASTGDFYAFVVFGNQAAVIRHQNGGFLTPVQPRPAPTLNTSANASNKLRVTWKGTSAAAYINDQPFITFNLAQAFQNTQIGLWIENDGSAPITYTFSNMVVTNPP